MYHQMYSAVPKIAQFVIMGTKRNSMPNLAFIKGFIKVMDQDFELFLNVDRKYDQK